MIGAPRATVGWFASLLHSRRLPIEFGVNPEAVTVTDWPVVTPLDGVIVSVTVAACAGPPTSATIPPTSSTAEIHRYRMQPPPARSGGLPHTRTTPDIPNIDYLTRMSGSETKRPPVEDGVKSLDSSFVTGLGGVCSATEQPRGCLHGQTGRSSGQ